MKKKKTLAVASSLLSLFLLSSCGGGSAVNFTAYWYRNPVTTVVPGVTETLVYDMTLLADSGTNTAYSVVYTDGSYTAELSVETEGDVAYYLYETTTAYSVQYRCGNETSEVFRDTIVTKTLFDGAQTGLRPLYSEKTVSAHPPATIEASSAVSCYLTENYSVRIDYDKEKTKGTAVITKEASSNEKTFELPDDYSYLDNTQLLFAARGVSASCQVQTYDYVLSQVMTVSVTAGTEASERFTFAVDGESKERAITYTPFTFAYNADNPGATQTAWYAKRTDVNTYRNVMLRLESPLPFNLGTALFTLKEASFTSV